MTVFVTTHYMDEAEQCGRVILIDAGRIVAEGTPASIIADACPNLPEADLNDAFIYLMRRETQ